MAPPIEDFQDTQKDSSGAKEIGALFKGGVYLHPIEGIVFKDRTTERFYRLFVDNGVLSKEEITL